LNQNPALINRPYCKKQQGEKSDNVLEAEMALTWLRKKLVGTFIKFSIISLLFTATRTTMHRLNRPAWLCYTLQKRSIRGQDFQKLEGMASRK
jgi:hypothetical protein